MPFLILLGLANSLMITVWSCIPLIVDPTHTGIAFGIATAASNFAMAVFPIIIARLMDFDSTFTFVEIFFSGCAFAGFWAAILLYTWDQTTFAGLEKGKPFYDKVDEISLDDIDTHEMK